MSNQEKKAVNAEEFAAPVKEKRPRKPMNRRKLRFGAYATGFTALFIAGLVVINLIASYLSDNYPLNLDFTADKIFSISEENKKYIKEVDKEIEIIVCADEASYVSAAYAEYLGFSDSTGGKYFKQAVQLLREYEKMNRNITLTFSDPQQPEFSQITQKYAELNFSYGDYLITRTVEGGTRHKLIKMSDMFTTQDSSGYGYGPFTISGSNVESAVTSAIYAVSSDKTFKVAVLTGHGEADVSSLQSVMADSNYEFVSVGSLVTNDLPKDADIVLIAGPSSDYSGDELDKITNFLKDNKESDKGVYYFADSSKPKLPNLWEFLDEWGIRLHEGMVYETDSNYHIPNDNTAILALSAESDYTKTLDEASTQYAYLAQKNQAITRSFETKDARETTAIVTFQDTTVMRPYDFTDKWKPEDAKDDQTYEMAVICKNTEYEGTDPHIGYVAAFSSVDLLSADWTRYTDIGNTKMVLSVSNAVVGAGDTSIYISPKSISSNTFNVTETASRVITILFAAVLPIAVLVIGLIIWMRRKNL